MPPPLRQQIAEYLANPAPFRARAANARIERPLRRAPPPLPMPETRGCELLRAVPNSNREIALVLGVSAPAVNQWRRGTTRPDEANARMLEREFGVPFGSWFQQSAAMAQALAALKRPPATR